MDLIWGRSLVDVDRTLDRPADDQDACEDQTEVPDAREIRASLGGDSEAYRRLWNATRVHVSKILWRFSRDRQVHEELVQDVFVEAYLSLGGFKGAAPFSHWLSRIATRVGYRYWRNTARGPDPEGLSPEEWERLADDQIERSRPTRPRPSCIGS